MELQIYFKLIKRWWWLLIIGAVIPAAISYRETLRQPPLYQAEVTLMVGTSLQVPNPDPNQIRISDTLADAYSVMVKRRPITEAVINKLGLERTPEDLASQITTQVNDQAQLLEITVTDTNPRAAALIANSLAEELILRSPTSAEGRPEHQTFVKKQLDDLQAKIVKVQGDIEDLKGSLVNLTSAAEIMDAQQRIQGMETVLATYQSTYASLLQSYISNSSPNILRIVEEAVEPKRPISRRVPMIVLVAAMAGLGLSLGAISLMEYLDKTLNWEEMRDKNLFPDLPTLGGIAKVWTKKGSLITELAPLSPEAEAIRQLRTNIFLSSSDKPLETILITSPEPRDGKSFATANLGTALAAGGKRVIIIDGDMRNPSLHEIFDLPNVFGLAELLDGEGIKQEQLSRALQETSIKELYFISSGRQPLDPASLLVSPRLSELLGELKKYADVILIDSPPSLVAPDAAILANVVDGTVLVIRNGLTTKQAVTKAKENLVKQKGAKILGLVFNQVRSMNSYSHYYHYYRHRAHPSVRSPHRQTGKESPKAFLSTAEAAQHLGVSEATVRRWCETGRLKASKRWFRWQIRKEDLQKMIKKEVN